MNIPVVYLANGVLRLIDESGEVRPLESRFGTDLLNKAVKDQQRHAWKQGVEGKFITGSTLWGKGDSEKPIQISLTSIARGTQPEQFLYTLRTEHVCAILSVQERGSDEQRIWNNNTKQVNHLSVHPTHGHIACSLEHKSGTANIAVRLAEESGLSEVTEGDSVDTAPSWVPGDRMQIVFQSAGLGRNKDGFVGALGPFNIQKLDVENGEMETLAENSKFDYLTPRHATDGTLYYIRRPYEGLRRASPLDMAKDVILFPFRLSRALFHFLNFFSMIYSGKQLKTVKQAGNAPMDLPQMIIWGNLVKAKQPDAATDSTSLVPKSWQLMRQKPGQHEEEIAAGVLCFDVSDNGNVIYSDGSRITAMEPDGRKQVLAEDTMVQQVAALRK